MYFLNLGVESSQQKVVGQIAFSDLLPHGSHDLNFVHTLVRRAPFMRELFLLSPGLSSLASLLHTAQAGLELVVYSRPVSELVL